jgi:hypothetical protein
VQDGGVVAVGVADLDDHEVVSLEREAVVRRADGGDRRRRDPVVHLVPEQRPRCDAAAHLGDRAFARDDAGAEPLRQQARREPVVAVAVGDEDVRQVPAVGGDPVAEHASLVRRHARIGQHRIPRAVDQRAGHR